MHGRSHSSPSRHTWTSARFATWLPESLMPRAGHRGDGTFYLIHLSGFKHLPSPAPLVAVSISLHQLDLAACSWRTNPLQKIEGRGRASWVFSSVCDYYRRPGHSQPPLVPFAQKLVGGIKYLLTWHCNIATRKDKYSREKGKGKRKKKKKGGILSSSCA